MKTVRIFSGTGPTRVLSRYAPAVLFFVLAGGFGAWSPGFLTLANAGAVLAAASWLVVLSTGMNMVLLTAGVDLSVGSIMYLAAVMVCLAPGHAPLWLDILGASLIGAGFGTLNGMLIVRGRLPAFIVTLSTLFVGRGLGLYLSSTRVVYAGPKVAGFGRAQLLGLSAPLWVGIAVTFFTWVALRQTQFGAYVRSIGADPEGARRAGVPIDAVLLGVYMLCGAAAGLAGFVSLSQTAAASGAFGQGTEFLAIAAAVLGGTSLFGGRGGLSAPVIGALLVTMVQNGLTLINANPYAYPVVTGAVIMTAALVDSLRSGTLVRR
jgi:ribose transport system permease protein